MLRDRNMLDRARQRRFRRGGEQLGDHFAAGEGGERQGANELLGAGGHYDLHGGALLHQRTHQLRGLICRDAAAHAEDDVHTMKWLPLR